MRLSFPSSSVKADNIAARNETVIEAEDPNPVFLLGSTGLLKAG
jgi:hypothetical protein